MPLEVGLSDGLAVLYQSIDAHMSSLNLAAVLRNLELVWAEFLGCILIILYIISIYEGFLK